jgi:2-polyprenyl-3-methyl-5-hydroxy-6-metoxy-1,4-benzoquinol methylase
MASFIADNKKYWDQRVGTHLDSEFYNLAEWKNGSTSLKEPELGLLAGLYPAKGFSPDNEKSLKDLRILHLMCHFGQDSMSLSRMGARVTGVDFSSKAIIEAKKLNEELNLHVRFVLSTIDELDEHQIGEYDLIFMSYGTLIWLDDLSKWARTVFKHLKSNGRLMIVDFHPLVNTIGDEGQLFHYSYFNQGPIVEETIGSYAASDAPLLGKCTTFNHSFEEIFQSIMESGLRITQVKEWNYSPYPCFAWVVKHEEGKYRHRDFNHLPLVYGLVAEK